MVRTMTIFRVVTSCCGLFGALRLKFTVGMVASAPKRAKLDKNKASKTLKIFPWLKLKALF